MTKRFETSLHISAVLGLVLVGARCTVAPPPGQATNRSGTQAGPTSRPDMSPVVSPGSRIRWDIPYVADGGHQQSLDLYAPPDAKNAPVVIFIHGGEWTKGDKSEVSYKPKFFNEQGMVFVSANYRLSGTAKHPAQVDDVAAAVRWVHDHAAEFGGNPRKLVLMGHSAGCHLVTLVALDARPLAKVGLKPSDLKAVVSWSGGAFDLVAKVAEAGMYADYIRQTFGTDEGTWRDASPMAHVGETKPMPHFLFVSAEQDKPASREATRKMVALVQEAAGSAELAVLSDKTHSSANHDLGMPGDSSGELLVRFIRQATAER